MTATGQPAAIEVKTTVNDTARSLKMIGALAAVVSVPVFFAGWFLGAFALLLLGLLTFAGGRLAE
jgi:hypothetical protein